MSVHIAFLSDDGEESDETWPSIAAFVAWATHEGTAGTWTAYADDPDGEGVILDQGRIDARTITARPNARGSRPPPHRH